MAHRGLAAQGGFKACHHERCADALARYVSDRDTESAFRQLQKIVVVAPYLPSRPAAPAVLQAGDGGKTLGEEMLLHLLRNFQLAIQQLSLRYLATNSRR